jgi:predicted transcriptional regulator
MVTVVKGSQLSEEAQKEIDVAQSYISRSLPVLLEMVLESREPDFTEEMAQKLEVMRSKIQERVNKLLQMNVVLSDQRKADLRKCDISIELPTEDAEGNKPE